MAAGIEFSAVKDGLVLLGTAGVIVPLLHRFRISPVIAFLLAGAALGPSGLGMFTEKFPWLDYFTIQEQDHISLYAELGVVFLLFFIGLELSLQRLITMRKLVFGLGTSQVAISSMALGAVAMTLGMNPLISIIIGAGLALSSTAVVIETLSKQKRLTSATGRASFAVLLLQDLAVVPILLLIGMMGGSANGPIILNLLYAFAQAAVVIAAIIIIGQFCLRPLFRLVAATKSADMFVATTLLVVVGTGMLTASFGLSMALGAFVAGLLLAETEYRRSVEATVEPFKGLLLGIFFFSVGMRLDILFLWHNALIVIAAVATLLIIKAAIMYGLAHLYHLPRHAAIKTALLLSPGGEFAFVLIGLAMSAGLIPPETGEFVMMFTALSMALVPALDLAGRYIAYKIDPPRQLDLGEAAILPATVKGRVLLIGFGRVGRVVAAMLTNQNVPFLPIDNNPEEVAKARGEGHKVYFGDTLNPLFLQASGIDEAPLVIIAAPDTFVIDKVVAAVKRLRPDVMVVARARDADQARHLYELGATEVILETVEASLQISEAALMGLGLPPLDVSTSIDTKRAAMRLELLQAAQDGLLKAEAK